MRQGDIVLVREPCQRSKKSKWAYEYIGRLASTPEQHHWSVEVAFEGEDGSRAVYMERRTSVQVVSALHLLAQAAGD